jgi:hypothetical protein
MVTGKSSATIDGATRIGFTISILLHLILVGFIASSPAPETPQPNVISVTIEPPAKTNRPQIVSPSETKKTAPAPEIPLRLSDNDSSIDKEQIKRGDNAGKPAPAAPPRPPSQPQQRLARQQDSKKAPNPPQRINNLKLDEATLSERFGRNSANNAQRNENQERAQEAATNPSSYAAFSRPPGSGAAFLGNAGTNDFLPNLPDGDITLLNAKANQYAGFVRRVAVQVFAQLRAQGWERLSAFEISRLSDFTSIEAVLSPEGRFMRVRLLASSGSSAFDAVVNLSVSSGASDPNPPAGARASDGLIHFVFKARSWSQVSASRRTGAPVEHRWLLLATGLE